MAITPASVERVPKPITVSDLPTPTHRDRPSPPTHAPQPPCHSSRSPPFHKRLGGLCSGRVRDGEPLALAGMIVGITCLHCPSTRHKAGNSCPKMPAVRHFLPIIFRQPLLCSADPAECQPQ